MSRNMAIIPPPKLLDQISDRLRVKGYSPRTEEAYREWAKRYVLFFNKRYPKEMGAAEIEAFISHLTLKENLSGSTQNQAFNALVFFYREVLHKRGIICFIESGRNYYSSRHRLSAQDTIVFFNRANVSCRYL